MSVSRFLLSLLLGMALAGAPVLHAVGKSVTHTPDNSAGAHAGHAGSSHPEENPSAGTCAQHDTCNGQCCTSCAHSFTGAAIFQIGDDHSRSVMTPAVQHLVFSSPVFLRERPPRLLSL